MTVTLKKDEILQRANGFMREFADAHYEMGEAQNFIRGLCEVFGFSNKRMVSFEQRVKKLGGKSGRIDGFYPGKLLIEMKSRGEDLDKAFTQATEYLPGLPEAELPDYCLVSDFENLHLYDLSAHAPPLKHQRRRVLWPTGYPLQPSPHWRYQGQLLIDMYEASHEAGE